MKGAILVSQNNGRDTWDMTDDNKKLLEASDQDPSHVIYAEDESELEIQLGRRYPADPEFPELTRFVKDDRLWRGKQDQRYIAYEGLCCTKTATNDSVEKLAAAAIKHGSVHLCRLERDWYNSQRYTLFPSGLILDRENKVAVFDPKKVKRIQGSRRAAETKRRETGRIYKYQFNSFAQWIRNDMRSHIFGDEAWEIKWWHRIRFGRLWSCIQLYEKWCKKRYRVHYHDFAKFLENVRDAANALVEKPEESDEYQLGKWIKMEWRSLRRRQARERREQEKTEKAKLKKKRRTG